MLHLRPYKKCDAGYIVNWCKDEVSFHKWCADRFDHYPISAEELHAYYEAYAEDDGLFAMTAFDDSDTAGIAGHLMMRFLDKEKTVLRFGFIIVDTKKRGRGVGKEMLSLAVRYAFEILRVEKVTLGVFENNAAARHCYKAVGFREASPETAEYYSILGEKWKCLELEMEKGMLEHATEV